MAQKQTALEVVYSRLCPQARGPVLPLAGSKGDTDSFYEAFEDRLCGLTRRLNAIMAAKARAETGQSDYIELIQLEVRPTKISLHQLMGLAVQFHEQLKLCRWPSKSEFRFQLGDGIFDLSAFSGLSSEMVSLCSQLNESKLDEGSPWADVDRDKAQFGSLSELRADGNMALMQLEEHFRTLDAETRAKVDGIFASHTMERLEYVRPITAQLYLPGNAKLRSLVVSREQSLKPLSEVKDLLRAIGSLYSAEGVSEDTVVRFQSEHRSIKNLIHFCDTSGIADNGENVEQSVESAHRQNLDYASQFERAVAEGVWNDLEEIYSRSDPQTIGDAAGIGERWRQIDSFDWRKLFSNLEDSKRVLRSRHDLSRQIEGLLESSRHSESAIQKCVEGSKALSEYLSYLSNKIDELRPRAGSYRRKK